MVLFVLRVLILQMRMRSHPVGLDVRFLVGPFVYFHTSCVRTVKALVRLRRCTCSPEPLLVAYVISTVISWAGSFSNRLEHLGFTWIKRAIFFRKCGCFLLAIMVCCLRITVMFLSSRTDKSGQTLQTQIDQGLHCLQFPLHLLDALL